MTRTTLADRLGRALGAAARAADSLLDSLGRTPPRLELPPRVVDDLDAFFAGTVDLTGVTIRRGHVPGIPHPRAFALPGLIYLGADPGVVLTPEPGPDAARDPGAAQDPGAVALPGRGRPRATPTLVHELTHLWQGRHLGARYVVRALGEQVRMGRRAYDWRAHLPREQRRPALPVEAHAQLVSEAYARHHGFAPAAPAPGWRDEHEQAATQVLTGLRAGDADAVRGARFRG